MKKLLLPVVVLFGTFCQLDAQKYVPLDTWPYVFCDFVPGTIITKNNTVLKDAEFNISVTDGSLHFIKDDVIMQAEMGNVYKLRTKDAVYVNVSCRMYRILSETADGCILEDVSMDVDALNKTDIGYGISSTMASSQNYNSVMGMRSEIINKTVVDAKTEKFGGKEIPVLVTKCLYTSGHLVKASKYELGNCPGIDRSELNSFLKQSKIKWNNVESLESMLPFLKQQFGK